MKEIDRIEGAKWLQAFQQMQHEAGSIVGRICPTHGPSLDDNFTAFKKALEVLAHGSLSDEFTAFEEALEKLPRISEGMKALAKSNVILEPMKGLTKSDVRIVRATQKYEVKALNAFIEACKLGIYWAQQGFQNRSLEAAVFFRFTQAYKWWEASDRGSSILFSPR